MCSPVVDVSVAEQVMDPFLYALLRAVVLQMKRILYYGGTETPQLLLKCNTPCETTVVRTPAVAEMQHSL